MEIERKFVTNRAFLEDKEIVDVRVIQQYYTSFAPEQRYRKQLSAAGEQYFYTCKSDGDLVRTEDERVVTKAEFTDHLSQIQGSTIWKSRVVIRYLDQIMECDLFFRPYFDQLLVEIEFPSEAAAIAFVPPPAFRDVTADKRYKNKWLIQHGFPTD